MNDSLCPLCQQVSEAQGGISPRLIHDFGSTILIAGDHQHYPGYCLLLLKQHHREMHDLSHPIQEQIFRDLMTAASAIAKAYKPWKMNYASLGNQVEHLHWHLMPRYESDPKHRDHPWANAAQFSHSLTTPESASSIKQRLNPFLP